MTSENTVQTNRYLHRKNRTDGTLAHPDKRELKSPETSRRADTVVGVMIGIIMIIQEKRRPEKLLEIYLHFCGEADGYRLSGGRNAAEERNVVLENFRLRW